MHQANLLLERLDPIYNGIHYLFTTRFPMLIISFSKIVCSALHRIHFFLIDDKENVKYESEDLLDILRRNNGCLSGSQSGVVLE
jgi:hypothetical protein